LAFDADGGATQRGDDETQDVDHLQCTSKHIECPRVAAQTASPGDSPAGIFAVRGKFSSGLGELGEMDPKPGGGHPASLMQRL
jgi:hypothetical protein